MDELTGLTKEKRQEPQMMQEEEFAFDVLQRDATVKDIRRDLVKDSKKSDTESYIKVDEASAEVEAEYSLTLTAERAEAVTAKYAALESACQTYLNRHKGFRWTQIGKRRQYRITQMLASASAEKALIEKNAKDESLAGVTLERFLVTSAIETALGAGFISATDTKKAVKNTKTPGYASKHTPAAGLDLTPADGIMSLSDFKTLVQNKQNGEEAKNLFPIAMLLDTYHQLKNDRSLKLAGGDINHSGLYAVKQAVMRIIVLCSTNTIPAKNRSEAQGALYDLFRQCVKEYTALAEAEKQRKAELEKQKEEGRKKFKGTLLDMDSLDDLMSPEITSSNITMQERETIIDNMFSEYTVLDSQEAMEIGKNNPINIDKKTPGTVGENVYDMYNGYVMAAGNYSGFNQYVRGRAKNKKGFPTVEKHEKLIRSMDEATVSDTVQQKTRFFRMVKADYLRYALGIPVGDEGLMDAEDSMVDGINKKVGTVITDDSYMSAGYKVDNVFKHYPVMITMLCDKGTKLFHTDNFSETEVIFGRNTSYMIMGACVKRNQQFELSKNPKIRMREKVSFNGIEIFVKVLKKDDDQGGE